VNINYEIKEVSLPKNKKKKVKEVSLMRYLLTYLVASIDDFYEEKYRWLCL